MKMRQAKKVLRLDTYTKGLELALLTTTEECDTLRAENAALKAKLEKLESDESRKRISIAVMALQDIKLLKYYEPGSPRPDIKHASAIADKALAALAEEGVENNGI
jgi:hypothetical protein